MKNTKPNVIKWLAKGVFIAGAADTVTAGIIFHMAFTRRKPKKRLIWCRHQEDEEHNYFEKYRPLKEAGQAWLREMQPVSEYWTIRSKEDLLLNARFIPAEPESRKTIIGVHGYHSTGEEEYVLMSRMFHEAGYNVLLIDQRTHGASEGKYIGLGCLEREDLVRWIREMDHRFHGQGEIFLHGVSMGAATVLMTSDRELPASVKGIVADCGYTTPRAIMNAIVKEGLLRIPFADAVIDSVDMICKMRAGFHLEDASSLKAVANTHLPVFIIHGDEDMLVPVTMAEEIYSACGGPKKLWIVKGANHAESSCLDQEEYKKRVTEFLNECSLAKGEDR